MRYLFALSIWVSIPAMAAGEIPVQAASFRTIPLSYASDGLVQPVRESRISAQVPGRVLEVAVKAGDRIAAGQLLVRLDDREQNQGVAGQQAQVIAARAQLENAEAQLKRTRELVSRKFMSPAALDQAESQARSARAQVEALKAGLGSAAVGKSYTRILAPYAGVVASLNVEQGDMASPGQPLMNVYAPGDLRVVVQVPQARLEAVRAVSKAQVELSPGHWKAVPSVKILPAADAATQSTEVRLEGLPLEGVLPGQSLRVLLATGQAKRLVVPISTILRRGELVSVYVLAADGRFVQRLVRLGEQFGEAGVEVLAGLSAGEKLALDPVRAGMKK